MKQRIFAQCGDPLPRYSFHFVALCLRQLSSIPPFFSAPPFCSRRRRRRNRRPSFRAVAKKLTNRSPLLTPRRLSPLLHLKPSSLLPANTALTPAPRVLLLLGEEEEQCQGHKKAAASAAFLSPRLVFLFSFSSKKALLLGVGPTGA